MQHMDFEEAAPQCALPDRRSHRLRLWPRIAALAAALAALAPWSAAADSAGTKHFQWFTYSGDYAVGPRWRAQIDASYRVLPSATWKQWTIRPGVTYALSPHWQLNGAYSYYRTYPNGFSDTAGAQPEHRFHQQLEHSLPTGPLVLRNRFRFEERLIGSASRTPAPPGLRFQDRSRYMLRADVPLRGFSRNGHGANLTFYDEIFASLLSSASSAFERNRIYAGLSLKTSRTISFEAGVFYQAVKPPAGGPLKQEFAFLWTFKHSASLFRLLQHGGGK